MQSGLFTAEAVRGCAQPWPGSAVRSLYSAVPSLGSALPQPYQEQQCLSRAVRSRTVPRPYYPMPQPCRLIRAGAVWCRAAPSPRATLPGPSMAVVCSRFVPPGRGGAASPADVVCPSAAILCRCAAVRCRGFPLQCPSKAELRPYCARLLIAHATECRAVPKLTSTMPWPRLTLPCLCATSRCHAGAWLPIATPPLACATPRPCLTELRHANALRSCAGAQMSRAVPKRHAAARCRRATCC